MLKGVVYCTVPSLQPELKKIVGTISSLDVKFIVDPIKLKRLLPKNSMLFLLLSVEKQNDITSLLKLYKQCPQSYLIFYHNRLNIQNISQSELSHFSYIIIGDERERNLGLLLQNLSKTYWKKIPYQQMGLSYQTFSIRLKKVMHYIETHDLKKCSSTNIAHHLNISNGYFSQEFKRETDLNYREFMQNLLAHYETILFDQMELPAKAAAQMLGYSELSSFSRSFKKRKGYPPSYKQKQCSA